MSRKKTISQVKLLTSLRPSKEWSARTKELLLSQIQAQQAIEREEAWTISDILSYTNACASAAYRSTIGQLFTSPATMVATLSIFFGGVVGATFIAQESLPGEPLYVVKQTSEALQMAVVPSDTRTQLEFGFVEKRMRELDALSKKSSSPQKERDVKELLVRTGEHLNSTNNALEKMKTESASKALPLASFVQKKAQEYQGTLSKNTEAHSLIAKVDETQTKALEVLLEKKDASKASSETLSGALSSQIQQTEQYMNEIYQKVRAATLKKEEPEMLEKSTKARAFLEQAKESLAQGKFREALGSIAKSKELVVSVEQSLELKGLQETGSVRKDTGASQQR